MQLDVVTKKSNHLWALLFFTVVSFVFCLPLFYQIHNWGIYDWDHDFLFHGVPNTTILVYHQIPLWNPYSCGGNVLLAHPEARFLSPLFLLELLFGVITGLKLEIWVHILIGMYGMYLITANLFRFAPISRLLPPIIYMLSGMYAFHIAVGHTRMMTIAYIPYVFYFFIKAVETGHKYAIVAGCFLALMILEGGTYSTPHTALFILMLSFFLSMQKKSLHPLLAVFLSYATCCLVAAFKLLPALDFSYNFHAIYHQQIF